MSNKLDHSYRSKAEQVAIAVERIWLRGLTAAQVAGLGEHSLAAYRSLMTDVLLDAYDAGQRHPK